MHMEWLYLLGSAASIISVIAVILGFARRREAITEQGFRMLFSLARIHRRTPMDGVRTAEGGG